MIWPLCAALAKRDEVAAREASDARRRDPHARR